MNPKVSVIVPCWGVEKYLDQCVESLVNQSLKDIEIILVDDESPDRVPEMCDEWAKKDCRIKVIHKKNGGLGYARNSGLEQATGEYVTFIDSDDWVELNAYEKVYKNCKTHQLDVCWFQCYRVMPDGKRVIRNKVQSELFIGDERAEWYYFDAMGHNPGDNKSYNRNISSCMALFRRESIINSGIKFPSEREVASEDYVFLIQYLRTVKSIGVMAECFYNYRITSGSISQSFTEAKYQRIQNMLKYLREYCMSNFDKEKYLIHYYSRVLLALKSVVKFRCITEDSFVTKIKLLNKERENIYFKELIESDYINKYSNSDKFILYCMKYRLWFLLNLIYNYKYKRVNTI